MAVESRERRARIKVDVNLESDLHQVGGTLYELSKRQETSTAVQKNIQSVIQALETYSVDVALIFMMDSVPQECIASIASWMEMPSVSFTTSISLQDRYTIRAYTIKDFIHQARTIHEATLKIFISDQDTVPHTKQDALIRAVVEEHPAVHFVLHIGQESNFQVPGIYTEQQVLDAEVTLFQEWVGNEEVQTYLKAAHLMRRSRNLQQAYQLVEEHLGIKEQQLRAKSMLLHKKEVGTQQDEVALSSKEISFLKSKIDTRIKRITRQIEDTIENFDKEDEAYLGLQEDIVTFLGFVTHKNGKYLHLKIAEGAIQYRLDHLQEILNSFFERTVATVEEEIIALESVIQQKFTSWKLSASLISFPEVSTGFTREIVNTGTTMPDKPYEKQVPFKGIGALLMELRTPLFMLMPFMMIFGLFGALVEGEDLGHIDSTLLFYENRPSIAIDQLPEARNNEYRRFINDVEKLRAKTGAFHKEINSELVTEPQLAVKFIQVPSAYGNKMRTEETLDYHFDNKNQVIYLFLNENADRNFVTQQLLNPEYGLLNIPVASGGGSLGIGAIIKALSSLKEYRYLILVILICVLTWFVITRKASMDKELANAKYKEQSRLNADLKQYIERGVKQSTQKWKAKYVDMLQEHQETISKNVDRVLTRSIEERKHQKVATAKLIQKRLTMLKNEKSKMTTIKSDHRKVKSKLDQLETKVKRIIR